MNLETENPYKSPKSDVVITSVTEDIVAYRKQLVPRWIKVFGWLFIVFAVLVPLMFIYSIISGTESSYSLLGLNVTGTALSPNVLVVNFLFVVLGISAYGLLFGKSWGLKACLITGYLGLAVSLYSMLAGIASGNLMIRLELIIQIPYLIKLHKIRNSWSGCDNT